MGTEKKTNSPSMGGFKLKRLKNQNTSIDQVQHNPVQHSPDSMIHNALNAGRSMEEIKELIKLRNDEIARLAELEFNNAKRLFQKICPPLIKKSKAEYKHKDGAGKTEYWFMELDDIIITIKKPLSECGLSYDWDSTEENGQISVTCVLAHVQGHKKSTKLSSPPDVSGGKAPIQAKASTITYLRRYTLTGILGISSGGKDDDGHSTRTESNVVVMPIPTNEDVSRALKGITSGKITIEEACRQFAFTSEHIRSFEIALNNR